MSNTLFIYDIFDNIIEYLDPISILNLVYTCKEINNVYNTHSKLIDKKIIYKIFNYFNLWKLQIQREKEIKKKQNFTEFINRLNLYEINHLKHQACNIYKHFYNHPQSNIGDFLIYLVEHTHRYEPDIFLKYLVTLCDKRIYYQTKHNNNNNIVKYRLSTNDILYILTYCNLSHFIILLEHFQIKSNLISYIIKEMLLALKKQLENYYNFIDINEKIYKSLDYFFYKHVFGRQNFNLFLNHIIVTLLEHNKNEFVDYILLKRRRYRPNEIELTYQSLILAAIESNNIKGLEMIWNEHNRDNHNNKYNRYNDDDEENNQNEDNVQIFEKFILVITPEILTKICKNGWFNMLKWIVDNLLQNTINLCGYIKAIKDGLFLYEICINQNNDENFNELLFLKNYLTPHNMGVINNQIDIICKSRSFNNKKFIKL